MSLSNFHLLLKESTSTLFRHSKGNNGKLFDFYKSWSDDAYVARCEVCSDKERGKGEKLLKDRLLVTKEFPLNNSLEGIQEIINWCRWHMEKCHKDN